MKQIVVVFFLFFASVFSFAQKTDYGIKGAIENYHSTAPACLIVQVKNNTYNGYAYILSDMFYDYYCKYVRHKELHGYKYVNKCYGDIKNNKKFSIHDSDLYGKNSCFEKVVIHENIMNDSKNGLEYFINKYFDSTGIIKPCNIDEYYSIVKVLFDSNIQVGIECEWGFTYIQDNRFYQQSCNGVISFGIPEEYKSNPIAIENGKKRRISSKDLKKQTHVWQNSDESIILAIDTVEYKLVKVNGGDFIMGFPLNILDTFDAYYHKDNFLEDFREMKRRGHWAKPAHDVSLSDYYMGETEVTQALWKAVMGYNNSCIRNDNHPVEKVCWLECQKFVRKLNKLTNLQFSLPTEAQWEYAARGGNKTKGYYYSGSDSLNDIAWYQKNSNQTSHDVKTKNANEIGLYDMSGNVGEWCKDVWNTYKYTLSPQVNPLNKRGKRCLKVVRNNGYRSRDGDIWIFNRWPSRKREKYYNVGFRLALNSSSDLSGLCRMKASYGDYGKRDSYRIIGSSNDIFYYHTNHLGSTAFVTDQNRYVTQGFLYAPFGEITTEYAPMWQNSVLPKYAFNAKELDEETGMYYYEARYYNPPVFVSRDPHFERYPTFSPYIYCNNNPIKYIDPTGKDGILIIFPNYMVDTETRLGKQPLGHAGVLLIKPHSSLKCNFC